MRNVTRTASRRLYVLRSLKPFIPCHRLIEVFHGIVLSILFYASPLFCDPSRSSEMKLERIRKRAHNIICGNGCDCNLIPDFKVRRRKLARNFLTKCESKDHPLHSLVPPRLPRSGHFRLPPSSTARRSRSFFVWGCILANSFQSSGFLPE